jgi:hypothetical protein
MRATIVDAQSHLYSSSRQILALHRTRCNAPSSYSCSLRQHTKALLLPTMAQMQSRPASCSVVEVGPSLLLRRHCRCSGTATAQSRSAMGSAQTQTHNWTGVQYTVLQDGADSALGKHTLKIHLTRAFWSRSALDIAIAPPLAQPPLSTL